MKLNCPECKYNDNCDKFKCVEDEEVTKPKWALDIKEYSKLVRVLYGYSQYNNFRPVEDLYYNKYSKRR